MPKVLTIESNVNCGHSGVVMTSSNAKLTITGKPVLLKVSITDKDITGCVTPNNPDKGHKTCTKVSSVGTGEATKLKAGGHWVMLDTLGGATNGTVSGSPQTLLNAIAEHNRLTAK